MNSFEHVMSLWIPQKAGNLLASSLIVSFSRRITLHGDKELPLFNCLLVRPRRFTSANTKATTEHEPYFIIVIFHRT
jgi:hypothetical protein